MLGLCFGIAVKVHKEEVNPVRFVRGNLPYRNLFVVYSRESIPPWASQNSHSRHYYQELDACPLRMTP